MKERNNDVNLYHTVRVAFVGINLSLPSLFAHSGFDEAEQVHSNFRYKNQVVGCTCKNQIFNGIHWNLALLLFSKLDSHDTASRHTTHRPIMYPRWLGASERQRAPASQF